MTSCLSLADLLSAAYSCDATTFRSTMSIPLTTLADTTDAVWVLFEASTSISRSIP